MDSHFSSVQWWIQGRGQGGGPPLLRHTPPLPLPQIISGSGSASDVESVVGPFTLMKASLFATEMQLTFKIILDIAR